LLLVTISEGLFNLHTLMGVWVAHMDAKIVDEEVGVLSSHSALSDVFSQPCSLGGAQHVTLRKIFFTSKFSYVLFCNPTRKTEIGTTNTWGTTNSKPPRPIIYINLVSLAVEVLKSKSRLSICRGVETQMSSVHLSRSWNPDSVCSSVEVLKLKSFVCPSIEVLKPRSRLSICRGHVPSLQWANQPRQPMQKKWRFPSYSMLHGFYMRKRLFLCGIKSCAKCNWIASKNHP
jgi:hypothetical protein